MTGLEPANGGTTNHCLNHLATPAASISVYYYSTITTVYNSIILKLEMIFSISMKKFNNLGILGILAIGLGAIAILTNPQEQSYQRYANMTLKNQLKDRVCAQISEDLGSWIEGQCQIAVDTASPYLAEVVGQQTTRQNFLLFSIYQADLPLPNPLPHYHVETIGILGNFYTYQAKKL